MFLYHLVRPVAALSFKWFYRKIHVAGADRFPHGKPVLFVGNHPTGFLDPCVWACFIDEPLHFLTRGDLFEHKAAAKIMEALHMIPIYRKKDGYNSLKHNAATFEYCYKAFSENKTILIFSEGKCTMEKRLQPLQKGTSRMAFGVWDTYPGLDIHIVLAGINHTYPARLGGGEVMCELGQSIRLLDYEDSWKQNPALAYTTLTNEIAERLSDLMVIIQNPDDEPLAEHLIQIYRNNKREKTKSIVIKNNEQLETERKVCKQLNSLDNHRKAALKSQTETYFDTLKKLEVDDYAVAQPIQIGITTQLRIWVEFIPYLLGLIGHYLPTKFGEFVAKSKATQIEFYSSIFCVVSLFSFFIWMTLLLTLAIVFGGWVSILFVLLLPIWSFQSVQYKYFRHRFRMSKRIALLDTTTLQDLKNQRRNIMSELMK